jgi:predicted ATPase
MSFRSAAFPLIGREHHMRGLRDAFDEAMSGTATTICVQGESGAGKSALIRRFIEGIRDEIPEALILTGRCYQRESLPYKGVDSLVDALHRYLSHLDLDEMDALLPQDFAAAEQLFPMLQEVGDLMRYRRGGTPEPEANQYVRQRAFAAMREILTRLAERTRLVLVIDDLQWGDTDSAELLEAVLRPPGAPPLLFIAAYRVGAVETSPFVRTFRDGVPARDLVIEPLNGEQAHECALQLLGDSIADPNEVARVIARESDGSPLFITELVRAFTMAGPAVLRPDTTILDVLKARLRALDSAALALLQMISVHGRPILRAPLHRALSGGEFDKSLSTLTAQQLIRTRDTAGREAVEPAHDRIAEAAVSMLSVEELRLRHAQLATALETFEADAELLADHLLAAGQLDRAAKYVEEAAENAAAALAFDRAARLFTRAITLNPIKAAALRRRLSEINALSVIGDQ